MTWLEVGSGKSPWLQGGHGVEVAGQARQSGRERDKCKGPGVGMSLAGLMSNKKNRWLGVGEGQ